MLVIQWDLFLAILNEATGMRTRGLNASPLCARRILHLARAVEQWHEAAGINQLRRVAPGSEPGSSFTRNDEARPNPSHWKKQPGQVVSVGNDSSAAVKNEQLDAIEEETTEGNALLFRERWAIFEEIHGAAQAGEGPVPCLPEGSSE